MFEIGVWSTMRSEINWLSMNLYFKCDRNSRRLPFLAHNEKILSLKKQVITIYEKRIFLRRYNVLKTFKVLFDIMFEIN